MFVLNNFVLAGSIAAIAKWAVEVIVSACHCCSRTSPNPSMSKLETPQSTSSACRALDHPRGPPECACE